MNKHSFLVHSLAPVSTVVVGITTHPTVSTMYKELELLCPSIFFHRTFGSCLDNNNSMFQVIDESLIR